MRYHHFKCGTVNETLRESGTPDVDAFYSTNIFGAITGVNCEYYRKGDCASAVPEPICILRRKFEKL